MVAQGLIGLKTQGRFGRDPLWVGQQLQDRRRNEGDIESGGVGPAGPPPDPATAASDTDAFGGDHAESRVNSKPLLGPGAYSGHEGGRASDEGKARLRGLAEQLARGIADAVLTPIGGRGAAVSILGQEGGGGGGAASWLEEGSSRSDTSSGKTVLLSTFRSEVISGLSSSLSRLGLVHAPFFDAVASEVWDYTNHNFSAGRVFGILFKSTVPNFIT